MPCPEKGTPRAPSLPPPSALQTRVGAGAFHRQAVESSGLTQKQRCRRRKKMSRAPAWPPPLSPPPAGPSAPQSPHPRWGLLGLLCKSLGKEGRRGGGRGRSGMSGQTTNKQGGSTQQWRGEEKAGGCPCPPSTPRPSPQSRLGAVGPAAEGRGRAAKQPRQRQPPIMHVAATSSNLPPLSPLGQPRDRLELGGGRLHFAQLRQALRRAGGRRGEGVRPVAGWGGPWMPPSPPLPPARRRLPPPPHA